MWWGERYIGCANWLFNISRNTILHHTLCVLHFQVSLTVQSKSFTVLVKISNNWLASPLPSLYPGWQGVTELTILFVVYYIQANIVLCLQINHLSINTTDLTKGHYNTPKLVEMIMCNRLYNDEIKSFSYFFKFWGIAVSCNETSSIDGHMIFQ